MSTRDPNDDLEVDDGGFCLSTSAAVQKLRGDLERVASFAVPVLCRGENGAGREAIARYLHKLSPWASGPFHVVNCAAETGDVLEAKIFGTLSRDPDRPSSSKSGLINLSTNGTLVIDEVTELPASLQARLVDLIEERQQRLGFVKRNPAMAPTRIVAATDVQLNSAVAEQRFREDLYYYLSAVVVHVPPLRDRTEDIPFLLRRSIARESRMLGVLEPSIPIEVLRWATAYHWPGNLTELHSFAKRYIVLGSDAVEHDASESRVEAPNEGIHQFPGSRRSTGDADRTAIAMALEQTNWNRKAAAGLLQVSYKSLLTKMRKHGFNNSTSGGPSAALPKTS